MGWVYVIANAAVPNLVKVGYTDRDPQSRARELAATGVPGEYVVKFALELEDAHQVERDVHRLLGDFHYSKEWFRCSVDVAQEVIEAAAGCDSGGSPLVPGHALEPYFSSERSESAPGQPLFVVEPEKPAPPLSARPMFGDMEYTCTYCGRVTQVPSAKIVRCSYCGKSEVLT